MNYLRSSNLLAMYSSYLSGIIKDESLMLIPLDDHLIHRGHGVTSNLLVFNGHIYNLSANVSYLYQIAKSLKIQPPLTEHETCQALKDLASSTQQPNLFLQLFITAGVGNMTIIPIPNLSTIYATAWSMDPSIFTNPISEFTSEYPITHKFQNQVQNSHYLVNILSREHSVSNGGTFGLILNEHQNFVFGGFILPGFVSQKKLVLLKSEKNLPILEIIRSFGDKLIENGKLNGVELREIINVNEVYRADEGFVIGQDFIIPLKSLDGNIINNTGEDITNLLKEMLETDYLNTERSIKVDYSSYN